MKRYRSLGGGDALEAVGEAARLLLVANLGSSAVRLDEDHVLLVEVVGVHDRGDELRLGLGTGEGERGRFTYKYHQNRYSKRK